MKSLHRHYLFRCLVEGKYAPLFAEDEHQWIVDELMAFTEYEHFVARMHKAVKEISKGKSK